GYMGQTPDMAETPGFMFTPGVALTSSHAEGTKTMRLFGTVEIDPVEDLIGCLVLDEDGAEIVSENGGFTVSVEEGVLTLTAENGQVSWQFGGRVLKLLNRSGINTVRFVRETAVTEIDTATELRGSVYAELRAAGQVSKDFLWQVNGDGIGVTVAEQRYSLNQGELTEVS
ncbi:MAG: hypothetical protein MJ099_03105, partial [Clostridia bacterium]|nr:hypothetical protein [Clostridia bacterium]